MPERNTQFAELVNVNTGPVADSYTQDQINAMFQSVNSKLDGICVATGEAVPPGQTRFYDGRQIYNSTNSPLNAGRNGDGTFYAGFVDVTEGGPGNVEDVFARDQAAAALAAAQEAIVIAESDTMQPGEVIPAGQTAYALGLHWKTNVDATVPTPITEALLQAAGFFPSTTLTVGNGDTLFRGTLEQLDAGFVGQKEGDDCRIRSGLMLGAEFEYIGNSWQFRHSGEEWLTTKLTDAEVAQVGQRLVGSQTYRYQTLTARYAVVNDQAGGGSQSEFLKNSGDVVGVITQHLADAIHGQPGDRELLDSLAAFGGDLGKWVSHELDADVIVSAGARQISLTSTDAGGGVHQVQIGARPDGSDHGSIRVVDFLGNVKTAIRKSGVVTPGLELSSGGNVTLLSPYVDGLDIGKYRLPLPDSPTPGQTLGVVSVGEQNVLAWSNPTSLQDWNDLESATLTDADALVSWRHRLDPISGDVILGVANGDQSMTGFMLIKVRGHATNVVTLDPAISSELLPENQDPARCILVSVITDGAVKYATFIPDQPWS